MSTVILWCISVVLSGCNPYHDNMRARHRTVAKALMPVVHALEAYYADHSRYPEKLQELIPNYLPKMPSLPQYINLWVYRLVNFVPHPKTQRHYFLTVHVPSTATLQQGKRWSIILFHGVLAVTLIRIRSQGGVSRNIKKS